MRESEVVVGGYYEAKVNNQLVTVRLDEVRQVWSKATGQYLKRFDVTNMKTGRKTHFKSAAKLRRDVTAEYAKRRENERLVAEKVKDINSRLTKVPLGVKGTIADRLASVEAEHRPDPTTGALSAAARTNATVAQSSSEKATLSNPATEDKQRSDPISASGVATLPAAATVMVDPTTLNRPTIGLASQLSAAPASMVGLSNGDTAPHLIILARAGSGKTTTAIEGVKNWKGYGTSITPSTQQRAVWDALKMSPATASVCMVAFNKALRNDQIVFTPSGWVKIGDIEVGDSVYGPDGLPHAVTKVHPMGVRPMMEVTFSDGTTVVADDEHLWVTETIKYQKGEGYKNWLKKDRWKVRTTREIAETVNLLHRVPRIKPVEMETANLPIDPYLMGALIGDGSFRYNYVSFACAEQDLVDLVAAALPPVHQIVRRSDMGWCIVTQYRDVGSNKGRNKVLNEMRRTGLHGCYSYEKFVPEEYLFSSKEQRLSLLQGLMDTDGCSNGVITPFVTTSARLASDVQFLCQSLGGVCSIRFVRAKNDKDQDSYWVNVRISTEMCPFRLPRKINKFKVRKRDEQTPRKVVSVNSVGSGAATCISIDSSDHLFLTQGLIPTHNSIATELQSRVPPGVQAMTMHSMGFKAVQGALGRQQPNGYILDEYTADILGMDVWDAKKNKGAVLSAVSDLVSKCKVNLLNPTTEALDEMVDYYEIELNGSRREVFDLVPQVLERCRNPKGKITFDDMIWLPIVLNLPVAKFDVLIVDEAQDLSKCQQVLAKRAGSRLVFIGDDKQCLLPGTKITMEGGGLVEIEKVVEKPAYIKKLHGYRVCAFNPNMGAFVGRRSQGRQIQKTHVEEYSGDIITISLESKSVECTPNHRWWCRFSTNCDKKFCLYMMERSGQFRLGICQMKYSCGMGIAARARSEKAEKSWMLQIFDTLTEARLAEELASVEFGLPQLVFEHRGKTSPDQEFINAFYSEIGCNRERANRCLDYFGRKYDYPLWEAVTTDRSNYLSTMKGFVVHACNLITGCFDFKVDDSTPSGVWQTGTISRREYIGKVYGITVEPTERGLRLYLANGIVSHNSIYGFAGADCQSIHRLTEELKMTDRGCEVLPLTVTRRCGKAIVAEAQKIVPDFEAYESNPEGKVYYAKYPYRTEE